MKKMAKELIKNPLISGSAIVFIGGNIANVFQFLFNLFMSRNLSVVEYGVLASIMSFIALPGFITGAIAPTVIHFAGRYFATQDLGKLRGLYGRLGKATFMLAMSIFLLILIFLSPIGIFFHIKDHTLLFLADVIIVFGAFQLLNNAFLQAKLSFGYLSGVSILGALLKFAFGVLLVFLGLSVGGAVGAIVIATVIPLLFTFIPLRHIFEKKITPVTTKAKDLFSYGLPSAFALSALTFFITSDIILVKHFFNPKQAGLYAGLSLIGRVIFFLSGPISGVMFPLIVQKHGKGESYAKSFYLSLFLVFAASLIIMIFYYLFPDFVIHFFLKNTAYLSIKPYLIFFALFITMYSLLVVVVNFYLSIKKTKVAFPLILGVIAQAGGIWIFHNSFTQVISISFVIIFVLLSSLLLYYPYATRK